MVIDIVFPPYGLAVIWFGANLSSRGQTLSVHPGQNAATEYSALAVDNVQ